MESLLSDLMRLIYFCRMAGASLQGSAKPILRDQTGIGEANPSGSQPAKLVLLVIVYWFFNTIKKSAGLITFGV